MPDKCCVPFCKRNCTTGNKVHVFSFPVDEELSKLWLRAIRREETFKPSKHTKERHEMLVEVVVTAVLIAVVWKMLTWYDHHNRLPPGPWAWPILGSKYVKTAEDARKLHRQYGDIFRTKMGDAEMIVLCDYKLIKEAFQKVECTNRPDWKGFHFLTDGRPAGVIMTNGQQWVNVRRFLLRNLRDLGMGKSRLDDAIHHEAGVLVDDFQKHEGTTTIPRSINIAILNVIWQMVAGRRYNLDDQEIHSFMNLLKKLQEDTTKLLLPNIYPLIMWLPAFIRRRLLNQDIVDAIKTEALRLMKTIIEEHKASLDPSNPRDVIDEYLIDMSKETDIALFFSEEDLTKTMLDLFVAGFNTTSNMLRWICLYMAAYPEVQRRAQREIDEAVPRGALPSFADRSKLPYLEAVIHEVLRRASLIPLGVSHCTSKDIEVGGYLIPKGANVLGCSVLCHEDPHYWSCPCAFNPDRFLDQDGKFVSQKEGFAPFGIGRRQCLGEALARMELFIFTSALLQNFFFSPPHNKQIDLKPSSQPFAQFPKTQDIVITKRAN